jgi:hypothetical protein
MRMSVPYKLYTRMPVCAFHSLLSMCLGRKAAERAHRAGGMVPAAQASRRPGQARPGGAFDSIALSGLPPLQGQGVSMQAPIGPDLILRCIRGSLDLYIFALYKYVRFQPAHAAHIFTYPCEAFLAQRLRSEPGLEQQAATCWALADWSNVLDTSGQWLSETSGSA